MDSPDLEQTLEQTLEQIEIPDEKSKRRFELSQTFLLKPAGSLGYLETVSARIHSIHRTTRPEWKKCLFLFAGDHGVAEEGISRYPRENTAKMFSEVLAGNAPVSVLAARAGMQLVPVDCGLDLDDRRHPEGVDCLGFRGTANLAKGPAMPESDARQSIEFGIRVARKRINEGLDLAAIGEIGIGNTTSASAIVAAALSLDVHSVVGKGTGITTETMERKAALVSEALRVNQVTGCEDPLKLLSRLGGYEIGAAAGAIMACAAAGVPVLLDGFIVSAAALVASLFHPDLGKYLIAAHQSGEPGHRFVLDQLELRPLLTLDLRLGQGSGAALAVGLIESAYRVCASPEQLGNAKP